MLKSVSFPRTDFILPEWHNPVERSTLPLLDTPKITFKPGLNLILGPNGSGKSCLLRYLATAFLADLIGYSRFEHKYTDYDYKHIFKAGDWRNDDIFLPHLQLNVSQPLSGAFFWRPNHLPGNETSLTHALLTGYSDEARAMGKLIDYASSGQACQATQHVILQHCLDNTRPPLWAATTPRWNHDPSKPYHLQGYSCPGHCTTNALIEKNTQNYLITPWNQPTTPPAIPPTTLLLLDEPEQSLDLQAQIRLWDTIQEILRTQPTVQIICVTHSLLPLYRIQQKKLKANIIEPPNSNYGSALLTTL